jgi:hypothetical protein
MKYKYYLIILSGVCEEKTMHGMVHVELECDYHKSNADGRLCFYREVLGGKDELVSSYPSSKTIIDKIEKNIGKVIKLVSGADLKEGDVIRVRMNDKGKSYFTYKKLNKADVHLYNKMYAIREFEVEIEPITNNQ